METPFEGLVVRSELSWSRACIREFENEENKVALQLLAVIQEPPGFARVALGSLITL
jgi:hypothetical protein